MEKKIEIGGPPEESQLPAEEAGSEEEFQIKDRRHWQRTADAEQAENGDEVTPVQPTLVDELRQRASAAEKKLHEYIEAYKASLAEQEQYRLRLSRDLDSKVEQKFGAVLGSLLDTVDDLELALDHVKEVPEAAALVHGIELALTKFYATLEKHGVEKFTLEGEEFDPNQAEAVRVDPVGSAEHGGKVTETLRAGFRLGDSLIRPARVAVGRFVE